MSEKTIKKKRERGKKCLYWHKLSLKQSSATEVSRCCFSFLLLYKTNKFHQEVPCMLPCVSSAGKKIINTHGRASGATFFVLTTSDIILDLYQN